MTEYRRINDVDCRIIKFNSLESNSSEVIIVITGSPGIPEFYTEFAQELHRCTRLPVYVVGHAGHDGIENINEENTNFFDLDFQIEHKLAFITHHMDKHSKLHIIGHSIGAWILVELLNKNDYLIERIRSINLLYPTLQKFSETTNGQYVNNFVRRFPELLLLFFSITQWLPTFLLLFFIKLYLVIMSWPSYYVERVSLYLKPGIQKKSINLACESLYRINELNKDAINKVKHLTNVVYSVEDGWVPMHHIEDLKKFEPHIKLKELNVDHAFVLKYSLLVGEIVGRLIKNKRT